MKKECITPTVHGLAFRRWAIDPVPLSGGCTVQYEEGIVNLDPVTQEMKAERAALQSTTAPPTTKEPDQFTKMN